MSTPTPETPSDEFNAERFDRRHIPMDFLRNVMAAPLPELPTDELLNETLPPLRAGRVTEAESVVVEHSETDPKGFQLSPEEADFLRGPRPQRRSVVWLMGAAGVLFVCGTVLAWWLRQDGEEASPVPVPTEEAAPAARGERGEVPVQAVAPSAGQELPKAGDEAEPVSRVNEAVSKSGKRSSVHGEAERARVDSRPRHAVSVKTSSVASKTNDLSGTQSAARAIDLVDKPLQHKDETDSKRAVASSPDAGVSPADAKSPKLNSAFGAN